MSEEDPRPAWTTGSGPASALHALTHEDLSLYSVGDLDERAARLEAEIVRTRSALEQKKTGRSAADALFSFKEK